MFSQQRRKLVLFLQADKIRPEKVAPLLEKWPRAMTELKTKTAPTKDSVQTLFFSVSL